MARQWVHVHLGTGSLGLGFVAYLTRKTDFRVVLANRTEPDSLRKNTAIKEKRAYGVRLLGQTQRIEMVEVDDLLFTDIDRQELLERICDPSTVLLTTALRDGLYHCVPLICEMIKARLMTPAETPLFVIACENLIDSRMLLAFVEGSDVFENSKLKGELTKRVNFLPSVVDRICSKTIYDTVLETGRVDVESYAHWVIEKARGTETLEELLSPLVSQTFVDFVGDVGPYKMRKLWLVNGPHLVAAIFSKAVGEGGLDVFLGIL